MKGSIGVTIGVQVVPEGSIERSTGKMRRIIDNRNS
jgi:phenylacetate-coenzyme A ligase PaaK-like adenylate-forming protein